MTTTRANGTRLTSALEGVEGYTSACSHRLPHGTAFGSVGAVPVLTGRTTGGTALFVSAAGLAGQAAPPIQAVTVETEKSRIRVRWPDGTEHHVLLTPATTPLVTVLRKR
ncbi:hypothetical protein [Kitasatospora sp. NPDC058190]|uniref:hypothetical protein n=1 Tax=Kitasatospora sp. NPDC058190 TaxID=3346371 RepID=UPI0036D8D438